MKRLLDQKVLDLLKRQWNTYKPLTFTRESGQISSIGMRNVEIKAKARCLSELVKRAKLLSGTDAEVIPQHDTFYKSNKGRLKLRRFQDGCAELIFYDRKDTEGPKVSTYTKIEMCGETVHKLNAILEQSLGVRGDVKKIRELYLIGQTRVHIDKVEGLGDFVELEVVLKEDQTIDHGVEVAKDLMEKLGIEKRDLLTRAYMDLLLKDY